MKKNTLYLVELNNDDRLDYNAEKVLELTAPFLESHKVWKFPVMYKEGDLLSESNGYCKGFSGIFNFSLDSADIDYIDEVSQYFNNCKHHVAILPTDVGMRVFYARSFRNRVEVQGQDPLHHRFSLTAGPTRYPYYYTNATKEELEAVAKDFQNEQ